MVREERKHPALIWRVTYDVLADRDEPPTYWELVQNDATFYGGVQHARIERVPRRQWRLTRFEGPNPVVTYHRSLKEAKALGMVEARFNMAQERS